MSKLIPVVPIILCGGSGTRLWPLSRTGFPKQFLVLSGTQSLFQQAFERLQNLASDGIELTKNLIVTNEEHRFLALDQLQELQTQNKVGAPIRFLLEPQSKNTTPALTLAALDAAEDNQDPILVVTPADQTIGDQAAFIQALHRAIQIAQDDKIVIFGIKPTKAETGYGYIQGGKENAGLSRPVIQFTEKPNQETAQHYIDQGSYYWNSGMFVLKASIWLKAVQQFRSDIAEATENAWQTRSVDQLNTVEFVRPDKFLFQKIPAESIDYAVIEKCPDSAIPIEMLNLDVEWNDLGAWDAVWQAAKQNQDGNASMGDVLNTNTKNTLVIANHRLVTTVGVDNLIVIETADAVLVANKEQSQDVKAIVTQLEQSKREEKNLHRKVHRPWGWYDSVDEGERFRVKRIKVKPGASLSLQMHRHRAEHWIVVKGTAEIINGEQKITLEENESTFIPQGQKHRLSNPGTIPLEIIEVQTGAYLGEDDIIRFDDQYKRTSKDM
jgi:mannose-1-phosphate guanylyltransferase/mannose-6-phosphate isomerase